MFQNNTCTEDDVKKGKEIQDTVFYFASKTSMGSHKCLLGVTHVSKPKQTIFSIFLQHGE
jgi:hypothetical protein